jgi:hypothetical protein
LTGYADFAPGAIVADLEQDAILCGTVKETHGTQLEHGTARTTA